MKNQAQRIIDLFESGYWMTPDDIKVYPHELRNPGWSLESAKLFNDVTKPNKRGLIYAGTSARKILSNEKLKKKKKVKIQDLVLAQPTISKEHFNRYINDKKLKTGGGYAVKDQGKIFLIDGNHRQAVLRTKGKKKMTVLMHDLDKLRKKVK